MTFVEFAVSAADRDFPYKLFGKRLAWSLGYLPLLNVPIRTPKQETPGAWQDATDVDVLGFNFSANGNTSILVADCKDTMGNGAERIFWVRGLADLLGSDNVYLLKKRIPDNAKWLSDKLQITPIDLDGINHLQKSLSLDAFRGPYYEEDGYTALQYLYNAPPKESPYRAYISFFNTQIWSLPHERRLLSTIDAFNHRDANKTLNPKDKSHQAIILLGCLHLSLSIAFILSKMSLVDLQRWERRLREELFGGPDLLQQRQKFAHFVQDQHGKPALNDEILDLPSFPMLYEITYRLFSKRHALNDAIRFIDVARHYHAVSKPIPEWGKTASLALSNKFAKDILTLFVKANRLDSQFINLLDDIENFSIISDLPSNNLGQQSAPQDNGVILGQAAVPDQSGTPALFTEFTPESSQATESVPKKSQHKTRQQKNTFKQ